MERKKRAERDTPRKPIVVSDRDLNVFKELQELGWCRRTTLMTLVKQIDANTGYFRSRYRDYFDNEYTEELEYILDYYQSNLIKLAKKGHAALEQEGLREEGYDRAVKISGSKGGGRRQLNHSVLISDIIASVKLSCEKNGYTYIPPHEFLDMSKNFPFRVTLSEGFVEPDYIFGVRTPNGTTFFSIEADTGDMGITKFLEKIPRYKRMYAEHAYKTLNERQLPNMITVVVTSSEERIKKMCGRMGDTGNNPFIFTTMRTMKTREHKFRPDENFLNRSFKRVDDTFQLK